MSNGALLVIFLFGVSGFFAVIASVPWWLDRAIVGVLRTFRIFAYPNAIRLAVSLERDTAQWEVTSSYLTHPEIGSVKVGSVDSVCVHLDDNSRIIWIPNWIERRIIHDAVKQAIHRRINCHLDRTLPA
jgi:hypothetical protein